MNLWTFVLHKGFSCIILVQWYACNVMFIGVEFERSCTFAAHSSWPLINNYYMKHIISSLITSRHLKGSKFFQHWFYQILYMPLCNYQPLNCITSMLFNTFLTTCLINRCDILHASVVFFTCGSEEAISHYAIFKKYRSCFKNFI